MINKIYQIETKKSDGTIVGWNAMAWNNDWSPASFYDKELVNVACELACQMDPDTNKRSDKPIKIKIVEFVRKD